LHGKESSMYIRKLVTWSASALLFPAAPCYPADAAHGLDLAKRWCAACHLVSTEQQHASADVPAFSTIAKSSNFDPVAPFSGTHLSENEESAGLARAGPTRPVIFLAATDI
jgi:mono/diheme cytochrome c family protein